jgi:hypothetical protein
MSLPIRACPVAPRRRRLTVQPPDAATAAGSPQATAVPRLSVGAEGCALLTLDLGQRIGWAVRNADRAIASGSTEFEPGRFDGGGKAAALALLHRTLAQGGQR